jgi:hypothetical protein
MQCVLFENTCTIPEFPKPFELTKWLCVSSCLFLAPGTYAFYNQMYLYGTVCTYNTILSVNHWRDAQDGVRRLIDRISACTCFLVYFIGGCMYCRGIYFYGYGISILFVILSSFFTSNYLSVRWHPLWIYAHIMFHLSVSLSEFLVIYSTQLTTNKIDYL